MSDRPPIKLRTDWDVDDASAVIDFVTQLLDELWAIYGDRIIDQRWEETCNEQQQSLDLNDDEPF